MKFKLNHQRNSAEVQIAASAGEQCFAVTAIARALAIMRSGVQTTSATPEDTIAAATLVAAGKIKYSDFNIISPQGK